MLAAEKGDGMSQPKLLVSEENQATQEKPDDVAAAQALPFTGDSPALSGRQLQSNTWPIWTAVALSGVWLLLAGIYAGSVLDWQLLALPPHHLAALVAGLFMPLAAFWFIALYVRRSEDLKHAARALERSLVPLGFPGENAERHIESVTRRLAVHASELSAAIEMAQKEAARIEELFAQQTFRLAETTDEAGRKAASVKELLAGNHSEIDSRIAALEAKAKELDAMLEFRMGMMNQTGENLAEQLRSVDHTLETSAQNLAAAGTFAGQRAENYAKLLAESIEDFRNAASEVEGTAGRVAETLLGERQALASTSQRLQSDGQSLRATLKDEQAALERTADALAASGAKARDAVTAEIARMDDAARSWTSRLEAASNDGNAHLQMLQDKARETIAEVEAAAARARDIVKEGSSLFSEESTHIIEAATVTTERMRDQVSGLRSLADEAEQRWLVAFEQTVQAARNATGTVTASTDDMVSAGELAADKLASRMERLKEGWSQRLLELETATTQAIREARASSESLAETAEHLGGRILELLDKVREAASFADTERDKIGASVERIAADVGTATQALSAVHETLAKQIGSTFEGTARLEELLKSMSGSFAEILEDVASRTSAIEDNISLHSRQLSDASREASEMIREAGEGLEGVTSRMTGSGSTLLANIEQLSREAAEVESRLASADEISDRAAARLQSALADAMARLDSLGETLGDKAELVERLAGQSGSALQTAGEALASRAIDIQAQVDKAVNALSSAGDMFTQAIGDGESRALAASSSISGALGDLNATAERLADNVADIKARLEAVAGDLDDGRDGTLERFNEAVLLLTNAEAQLREHAFDMVGMAERSASQLRDVSGTLTGRAQEIITASQQAEAAAVSASERLSQEATTLQALMARLTADHEKFSKTVGVAADSAFMREAGQITDGLHSLAIDIDRSLETDLPDSAWEAYLKGDKSLFARRVLKLGSSEVRKKIRDRYEENAEFQEHVNRYCKRFELLLRRASENDRDGTMSVALISSHMGRLYVLLGQSIKRLHS